MLLAGDQLKRQVDGIIHEETQISPDGIDLTVNAVRELKSAAHLDFGGGEYRKANTEKLTPRLLSDTDEYGWWNLNQGTYIIEFNEKVNLEEGVGFVVPLERLTAGGCKHDSLIFSGELTKKPVLTVGPEGLNLKENSRVSRLLVWT